MTLAVVLDVNILASAATSEHGSPRRILLAGVQRQFQMFTSHHILTKLTDTFEKPYFAARLQPQDRADFVNMVSRMSTHYEPDHTVRGIAPDLEDDLVLGTAVAARADFLVTGDKGLLTIGEYRGVRIITAGSFLEALAEAEGNR